MVWDACKSRVVCWGAFDTADEVMHAHMGAPYLVTSKADGQLWVWSYADAFSGTKTISVPFGKDGKIAAVPPIPASFK